MTIVHSVPCILATLCGTFGAQIVLAQDRDPGRGFAPGDVVIRGRVTGIIPYHERSRIDLIGGHVDVPEMILPDVDLSVFVRDHWSVTGQTGTLKTDITLRDTLYGDIHVGSVRSIPLSLAVQYHVPTTMRLKPYVGAGVVANWFFGEKPAGGYVQHFRVSAPPAPLVKGGLDYRLDRRWLATFEVRRIFPPTQTIENQGVKARTSLDTITVGAGIGYRFQP